MMAFLTNQKYNFLDLIMLPEELYEFHKKMLTIQNNSSHIFEILDLARDIIINNRIGSNTMRYLLFKMNNRIIKMQLSNNSSQIMSGLYLNNGCIPFENMPFVMSLKGHNPTGTDLFMCLDSTNRDDELLARYLKMKAEVEGKLYTKLSELSDFSDIDDLVKKYNKKLYSNHQNRELIIEHKYIYIKEYEEDSVSIVTHLNNLTKSGLNGYNSKYKAWELSESRTIDSKEKKEILGKIYQNSKVALIYGAAGTGKTKLIGYVSSIFSNNKKIYLANTNTAVENLRRNIESSNSSFYTVSSFLSKYNSDETSDILIIDECSTISNRDMVSILKKAKFELLLLVGDVHQIESITFGNWFELAQNFVVNKAVFELCTTYRSNNDKLLELWNKVRHTDDMITEYLEKNNFSFPLDSRIFNQICEDEIILCLNYDGLYGINSINKYLQECNNNKSVDFGINKYKINDPVLFNDSNRFSPILYNNLKGRIIDVKDNELSIIFDIEVEKVITELDIKGMDLELIKNTQKNTSVVRFTVKKEFENDDDIENYDNIIPFNVAYALSIHKAQGLEFDSVKIVVTNDIDEIITNNIFYTAITRAKKSLRIFWTPETQQKIINNLLEKNNSMDIGIFKTKYHF